MDHRPEWIDRFRSDTLPRAHTDEDYWKGSTVRIRISFMGEKKNGFYLLSQLIVLARKELQASNDAAKSEHSLHVLMKA